MKKLWFIWITVLMACLLATPVASAQGQESGKAEAGSAEEQIKALEAATIKALVKADTTSIENYYADDAVIIRRTGLPVTKAQDIAALKSGALKFDSYDVREQKIRIYGNVAVVNLLSSAKGLNLSQSFNGDFRVTRIWVKLKGNWKLELYQVTEVTSK
jgi:ketosteroid isomerase-like protein